MVKCADCGFLTSRNKATRILQETESQARCEGITNQYQDAPICLCGIHDLWEEMGTGFGMVCMGGHVKILETLQKERDDCKEFVKWRQGFSPKEHQEMIDKQWERKNALKWHIIDLIALVIGAGLFTLLGAYISSH